MRIALFCNDDMTTNAIFAPLFSMKEINLVAVYFLSSPVFKSRSNIGGAFYLIKKMALKYWLYLVITNGLFKIFEFVTLKLRLSPKSGDLMSVRRLSQLNAIPCHAISDFSSPEFIEEIKSLKLDFLLIRVGSILKPELINCPKFATWCVHSSILPACKGIAGEFHTLRHDNIPLGSSIFRVTEILDEGPIIAQKVIQRNTEKTLFYHMKQNNNSAAVLLEKVLSDRVNEPPPDYNLKNQQVKESYFSWPQKEHMIQFRSKGMRLILLSEITKLLKQAFRV